MKCNVQVLLVHHDFTVCYALFIIFHFFFTSVQYAVFLCRYIKEWRRNPHWSFSCCLAALLPLNNLQGEIQGLVEVNGLQSQPHTGKFEKPTILSAVKDSGAIDVTLEDLKQDGDYAMETDGIKHGNARCHQGTQTELNSLFVAGIVVQKARKRVRGLFLFSGFFVINVDNLVTIDKAR